MKIRHIPSIHNSRKKQVAAYCRVSTDKTEQEESFDTQVSYYTRCITGNPEWQMVKIYSDEGRSATNTARRPGFLQMIEDAMAGKIDIILVKSISRFARNVVDCQNYIQQLRAKGVEVRFEKESINSLNPTSDMILSMMAAIAQDESRSISENIKWSNQKRYEKGISHLGSNHVLGYDEIDGKLTPNKDAWIIKAAFEMFLEGKSYKQIAGALTEAGAKRMRGETPLNSESISIILRNEIYVGDRHMQKIPPKNYLTKKRDMNAQYQSWYWRDMHEGIIDRETWEKVQAIMEERKRANLIGVHRKGNRTHFLYGLVFCAECGAPMIRRTMPCRSIKKDSITHNDAEKYCKSWCCKSHAHGGECSNTYIKEEQLLQLIADGLQLEAVGESEITDGVCRVMVDHGAVEIEKRIRKVIA